MLMANFGNKNRIYIKALPLAIYNKKPLNRIIYPDQTRTVSSLVTKTWVLNFNYSALPLINGWYLDDGKAWKSHFSTLSSCIPVVAQQPNKKIKKKRKRPPGRPKNSGPYGEASWWKIIFFIEIPFVLLRYGLKCQCRRRHRQDRLGKVSYTRVPGRDKTRWKIPSTFP